MKKMVDSNTRENVILSKFISGYGKHTSRRVR